MRRTDLTGPYRLPEGEDGIGHRFGVLVGEKVPAPRDCVHRDPEAFLHDRGEAGRREERVVLAFGDANSSALVTMPGRADYKYVVMPMRI